METVGREFILQNINESLMKFVGEPVIIGDATVVECVVDVGYRSLNVAAFHHPLCGYLGHHFPNHATKLGRMDGRIENLISGDSSRRNPQIPRTQLHRR